MSITKISEVEFGEELPTFEPDTSLSRTAAFAEAVGWGNGGGRFDDHEAARKQGLPGALVPGIMGLGLEVDQVGITVQELEANQVGTMVQERVANPIGTPEVEELFQIVLL